MGGEGAEAVGSVLSKDLLTFSGEELEKILHNLQEEKGHRKNWWF